jgi:hypothetical protein
MRQQLAGQACDLLALGALGRLKGLPSGAVTGLEAADSTWMTTAPDDGRRDFDFLLGSWRVHNRRLLRRLEGCTDWEEFETSLETRPVLGGLGNIDSFSGAAGPEGTAWEGLTLRLFDPETRSWSIWWAATSEPGRLFPPVVGGFADGVGTFLGDEVHGGRAVRVLYQWKDITPTSARWEQAFSIDEGKSWETNWVMSVTRAESG